MNELLLFAGIVLIFGVVVSLGRLFGKEGLTAWMAVAIVLANIAVSKQVDMFGMSTTLGNVLFASTFLATDILSESYGLETSKKAVNISMLIALIYIVVSQLILAFTPNSMDFIQGSMQNIFTISARTTSASLIMCYIANLVDVYLFEKLKKLFPKQLWLRNNVCTIICNCTENFAFVLLAFLGIYDFATCFQIALTTSIIEAVIALCDTPFVYMGRKICKREAAL